MGRYSGFTPPSEFALLEKSWFMLLELTEEMSALAHGVPVRSYFKKIAAYFLAKAEKTGHAVLILAREGYGEDAAMLARTLLDMAITLQYIGKDRRGRARKFWEYHWVQRVQSMDAVQATCGPLPPRSLGGGYSEAELRRRARAAQQRYGYPKGGWSPHNLREMAKQAGLEDTYCLVFKHGSSLTHSGPLMVGYYAQDIPGGTVLQVEPSSNMAIEALVAALQAYATLLTSWNDAFKVFGQREFAARTERIEATVLPLL